MTTNVNLESCSDLSLSRSLSHWEMRRAKEVAMIQASENTMSNMPRQRSRWTQPTSTLEMTVKSMLDLRQLESFSVSRSASQDSLSQASNGDDHKEHPNVPNHAKKEGGSSTLEENQPCLRPQVIRLVSCEGGIFPQEMEPSEGEEYVIYPEQDDLPPADSSSDFQVKALPHGKLGRSYNSNEGPDKHSPDSACSVDYSSSRLSSPNEDSESTEPLSVDGTSDLDEQVGEEDEEDVNTGLLDGDVPTTPDQEKFLKQHFETLASNSDKDGSCRTLERMENSISSRFLSRFPVLREPSSSASKLILDKKSAEGSVLPKQVTNELLKNGLDYQHMPTENGFFQNNIRSLYMQKKRKFAVEINRGRGKSVGSFPDSDGAVVLRKSQSVHDLVHNGSSISVEQCKHVVSELQDSMRKAIQIYHLVSTDMESSPDKYKIAGLLTETFSVMKKELDSLKDGNGLQRKKDQLMQPQNIVGMPLVEGSGETLSSPRHFGDEQTLALLEQYSELLLQAVERRMDKKL
uniref:MABP1/WRD62 coiled-coil domain-containing protein n=1 Tax=Micrurus lemniscatus lemniscatus TaxID=129467 RepID=A0A2D4HX86_MICLE